MTPDIETITVLHVDDEPGFPEMVASFLAREDDRFEVKTANSPRRGAELLRRDAIDCIVSDYDMPDQDGIEFLESVRETRPDLPFILYTGKGSEAVASDAISAGATDYLQKQSGNEQYELLANRIRNAVERYNTERELHQRSSAIEASIDGIAILNRNDEYAFVNQAHADAYGYDDPAALRGNTWRMCYGEAEIEWFESEVFPTLAETGEWRGEAVGTRRDGTTFPQELSLTRLDGGGLICIIRDISDQKRQERALATLHDATQELITLRDEQAVAEAAVEAARTALDRPLAALWLADGDAARLEPAAISDAGQDLIDDPPTYTGDDSLSWQAFQDDELRVYDDLEAAGEPLNADTPIRSEIVVPLGDHGVMNLGSTETEDFTPVDVSLARTLGKTVEAALSRANRERQLREHRDELGRQNQRLERIINAISHDLRSPLSVAKGRLELTQSDPDGDHLDDTAAALERIETLIDDLVTLATEGERASETEPVDIAEVARASWRNAVTDGATLRVETDLTIRADPGRVQQLLENLVRNSVEHGSTGSRTESGDSVEHGSTGSRSHAHGNSVEHGSTGNRTESDNSVEHTGVTVTVGACDGGFYVADNGVGIPRDDREHVFETGYSTSNEGTGFGLSIVQEIANAHGWDVGVAGSADGGARFEITGVDVVSGS